MAVKTFFAVALVTFGVAAACSAEDAALLKAPSDSGGQTVTGVVVAVDGGLSRINSFAVQTGEGARLTFVPASGLMFDGVAPLSHLQDHLMSGNPIEVTFEMGGGGELVATEVGDATGELGRGG